MNVAWIFALTGLLTLTACQRPDAEQPTVVAPTKGETMNDPARISKEEWRKKLTPEQYAVTCEGSTERAFTGKYWNHKEDGTYHCVRCNEPLFSSETKFDSGTGWPSFWAATKEERVATKPDLSHGMVRTEIVCARCGAHLGHVFEDGPKPTGKRFCVNSAALNFEKKKMEEQKEK